MTDRCPHCGKYGVTRKNSRYHYHCEDEIYRKLKRQQLPELEYKKAKLQNEIQKINDQIRELL
jgi:Ribonuclease G/E